MMEQDLRVADSRIASVIKEIEFLGLNWLVRSAEHDGYFANITDDSFITTGGLQGHRYTAFATTPVRALAFALQSFRDAAPDIRMPDGLRLDWKIDCDALNDDDLVGLAEVVARRIVFFDVYGIASGGIRFAEKLKKHKSYGRTFIIVDDVLTTGTSMEEARLNLTNSFIEIPGTSVYFLGIVIFARGPCPDWVYPIFRVEDWIRR